MSGRAAAGGGEKETRQVQGGRLRHRAGRPNGQGSRTAGVRLEAQEREVQRRLGGEEGSGDAVLVFKAGPKPHQGAAVPSGKRRWRW